MNKSLFSIGHGNTGYEDSNLNEFIDILKHFNIETLVDVRSIPTSNFASWFNKDYLKRELKKNNIEYRFAGDYLGGRPKEKEFYDNEGYVLYNKLSESDKYQKGLTRLVEVASNKTTVMMCSEKDYQKCHRSNLISKTLGKEWEIIHIISKSETYQHELENLTQLTLDGEVEWKSTRPVSPNG